MKNGKIKIEVGYNGIKHRDKWIPIGKRNGKKKLEQQHLDSVQRLSCEGEIWRSASKAYAFGLTETEYSTSNGGGEEEICGSEGLRDLQ